MTALVERWRPETNTFHMYHGECTLTLEDVAMLTDLPVDGDAVYYPLERSGPQMLDLVEEVLGARPMAKDVLQDGRLRIGWLHSTFKKPERIPPMTVVRWDSTHGHTCWRA